MNNKLSKLPTIQSSRKNKIPFRGGTSSAKYNQMQEGVFFDMANLFNLTNELDKNLVDAATNSTVDNYHTQIRVQKLKAELEQTRAELESYKSTAHNVIKKFTNEFENLKLSESHADINKMYNQVNLNSYSSTSKLYLYDESSKTVTVPDTMGVQMRPSANGGDIQENDFNRVFNSKPHEFWVRRIVNNSITFAEVEIEITMPDNIISNRDINTLLMSPFPFSSLKVTNLEYQLNGAWTQIPGLESLDKSKRIENVDLMGDKYYETIVDGAENMKLCFPSVSASKIRFTLRQDTYIEENGDKVFYIGLKSLDVRNEVVSEEYCTFFTEFEFSDQIPKHITGIVPHFNNASVLSDSTDDKKSIISYDFYVIGEGDSREYIKSNFPIYADKLRYRVEMKMMYDNKADVNPSLHSIDILYNTQENICLP